MRSLGWLPDPTLENRFPHNSAHERDTRTWAELLRTNFLASGLHIFPKTWPIAAEYTGVVFSASAHPPIADSERGSPAEAAKLNTNRWAMATGGEFLGENVALGQLCYYRVISHDKLAAAQPGIFAGWRIEAGMRYRGVCKVFSYNALKNKEGNYWEPTSVPEAELFFLQGEEPVFPLRVIAEEAVRRFEDPELTNLKDEEEFAIPWVAEHVAASCPRPRHSKITFNRMLEIGPTLGCNGCCGDSGYHNKECRTRFNEKYGKSTAEPEPPIDEPVEIAIGGYSEGGSSGSAPSARSEEKPIFAPPEDIRMPEVEAEEGHENAAEAAAAASWSPSEPEEEEEDGDTIIQPPPPPFRSPSQELSDALGRLKVRTDKERLEKPSEALPRRSKVSFCASYVEQAQLRRGPAFSAAACAEIYANEIWQRQQLDDASWRAITEPLIDAAQEKVLAASVASAYKERASASLLS